MGFKSHLMKISTPLLALLPVLAMAFAEVETRHPEPMVPEQVQRVEYLQQEVQELRGKVEELTHLLSQVQEQQKTLYLDLERRLTEKKTPALGVELNLDEPDSNPQAPSAQNSHQEEKAYQQAYKMVQNRDFDHAVTAFSQLIAQYPQGKYVPNARYWMGEIYLNQGKLDMAAQSFRQVYEQYPQHPKAADALLKLGYVEQERGQLAESKALLNKVRSQFPHTTSAQLAEARLHKINQQGQM